MSSSELSQRKASIIANGLKHQMWSWRVFYVREAEVLTDHQINEVLDDLEYPVIKALIGRHDFSLNDYRFNKMISHDSHQVQEMLVELIKEKNIVNELTDENIKQLVTHRDQKIRIFAARSLSIDMHAAFLRYGISLGGSGVRHVYEEALMDLNADSALISANEIMKEVEPRRKVSI